MNDTTNEPKRKHLIFHSQTFKWLILGIAGLILLIGAFDLGVNVGFRKAHYAENFGTNYSKNFGFRMMGDNMPPPASSFYNAHGVMGTILTISNNTVVIKDAGNDEKTLLLDPSTTFRQNINDIKQSDLKVSQQIVVIGEPNEQGQIEAKFIRVLN